MFSYCIKKSSQLLIALLMCVGILLLTDFQVALAQAPATPGAAAQLNDNNMLEKVMGEYKTAAALWKRPLQAITMKIFWVLALIDLVIFFGFMILNRFDLGDIVGDLVRRFTVYGFYLFLIRESGSLPGKIVESFQSAASLAANGTGVVALGPSDIFDAGIDLVAKVWEGLNIFHPVDGFMSLACGLVIMFCFVVIAANVLITLIEMYIAVSGGIILLGFAGGRWTRDIANRYMFYLLSVGMKLFSMQLLVGLGQTFILGWAGQYDRTLMDNIVIMSCSGMMVLLVKSVPEVMAGLLNGVSVSPNQISPAKAAAFAVGGAALAGGAVAAGVTMKGAMSAASQAAKSQGASGVGATMKTMYSAAKQDLSNKFQGEYGHQHSNLGGRMTKLMSEQIKNGVRGGGETPNSNTQTPKSYAEKARKRNNMDEDDENS